MGYERSGKAIYFKNNNDPNKLAVHIADAGDEEKAHLITTRLNNSSSSFIPLAVRTCSPNFYPEKVAFREFRGRISGAIDALNKLDAVKKSLFYGHDNNLISEGQTGSEQYPGLIDPNHALAIDVIHAILGIATEAGELLEALRNAYNGNTDGLDWVNIKEEYGDLAWYEALLAKSGDYEFEEVWAVIIKKLAARYPDKYSDKLATERDLATERAILEENAMQDEGDLIAGPDLIGEVHPSEPLNLAPTPPVSGKANVEAADTKSATAFDRVDAVQADAVERPTGSDNELSKPAGYRNTAMPDEHIARQPVRREDLD